MDVCLKTCSIHVLLRKEPSLAELFHVRNDLLKQTYVTKYKLFKNLSFIHSQQRHSNSRQLGCAQHILMLVVGSSGHAWHSVRSGHGSQHRQQ